VKKSPPPVNSGEPRNLSEVQFRYTNRKYKQNNTHMIEALHPQHGSIASLSWGARTGEIYSIGTDPHYRGLGMATTLWDKAHTLAAGTGIKAPVHSKGRTKSGDAWAKSTGAPVPPLKKGRYHHDLS
jgi:GNAT superfamily N-acetyltransferase